MMKNTANSSFRPCGVPHRRFRHPLTNLGHLIYTRTVIVNIAEAKAQLSELAARASQGEEVILARHGQPIARLMPLAHVIPAAPNRGFGIGREDFIIPDDFDEPLSPEILELFEGGSTNTR